MNVPKSIILVAIACLVIAGLAVYPFSVGQTDMSEKHALVDAGGFPFIYAQSFKPDKEFLEAIVTVVCWEGTAYPLPKVDLYFCTASEYMTWSELTYPFEGEYSAKAHWVIPVRNTNLPINLVVNQEVDTSQTYFLIIRPDGRSCPDPYDSLVFCRGSSTDAYADGQMYWIDCPSPWMSIPNKDLYFVAATSDPQQNNPPVAEYSPNGGTYETGTEISFDGSASYDPDGDSLYYRWMFGSGATPTSWDTSPYIAHTFNSAGSYQVTLEVADSMPIGLTATRTKTFVITSSQPDTYSIECFDNVGGAMVTVTGPSYNENDVSDTSGYTLFTGCSAGDYTITYSKPGYFDFIDYKVITFTDIQSHATLQIDDGGGGGGGGGGDPDLFDVTLTILSDQGSPIAGAIAKLVSGANMFTYTVSDPYGRALFFDVEPGTYTYFVEHDSYKTTSGSLSIAGNANFDVLLEQSSFEFDTYLIVGIMLMLVCIVIAVFVPGIAAKLVMVLIGVLLFVVFLMISMGIIAA